MEMEDKILQKARKFNLDNKISVETTLMIFLIAKLERIARELDYIEEHCAGGLG